MKLLDAPMDFTTLNNLVDAAIAFALAATDKEKAYQQQIADLQAQLTTANSTLNADETELKTLNDKLAQLSGVLTPAAPAPTA